MRTYYHTQIGWIMLIALLAIVVFTTLMMALAARVPTVVPVVWVILVMTGVLFCSLTVEIRGDVLQCRFGPGLIRKTFRLADIRDAQVVRNRWYYGWGIRLIPGGWMFNVSGLDAVELTLVNGRKFRIGTDEPEELVAALRRQVSSFNPPPAQT